MMNHTADSIPDGGTGKDVHERDWVCIDCDTVYCADADVSRYSMPDNCPDCGDHWGWQNKKTGEKL